MKMLNKCSDNKRNWSKERSQSAIYLAELFTDRDKKRFYLSSALTIDPGWREPYIRLAENSFNNCEWLSSISYCEKALLIEKQEGPLHVENIHNYTFLPYSIMYKCYIFIIKNCTDSHNFNLGHTYIDIIKSIENKTNLSDKDKVNMWKQIYLFYFAGTVIKNKKDKVGEIKKYLNMCIKESPETFLPEYKRIFGVEK